MRSLVQVLASVLLLTLTSVGVTESAATEGLLAERVLGKAEAPVTLIEYSSLTCPHCATFHRETLPKVREAYIDTGKVRYIFRDFPLGGLAMAAAIVARCVDPDRYFGFIDVLFREQSTWANSKDSLAALKALARQAGLSEADFEACLNNRELLQGIQKQAVEAQQEKGIDSTPTLFIDDKKLVGEQGFDDLKGVIDQALEKTR